MTRIIIILAAVFCFICQADAQTAKVVATCGAAGYAAGGTQPLTQDVNGNGCGQASVIGVEQPDVSGTFTNATQATSITSTSQDGYGTVLISINGTYAGAAGVFELSDDNGVTWSLMSVARADGSGSETGYTALANVTRAWVIPVAGMDLIRIRSTAVTSGTVNARISSTSVNTSPIPPVLSIISGNATGTTGAVVGTLAAAANKLTTLCDFDVSATGTGSVGPVTIAGLLGGSRVYQLTAPSIVSKSFNPCLPASAPNTAITITTTADASATAVDVNSSGTQQ